MADGAKEEVEFVAAKLLPFLEATPEVRSKSF
jgi:hypothetical protein